MKLKTNTAVRIAVGPFLDATDGVTPETGMTVTNITCELFKNANDGSAVTRTALTLSASGGSNDMVHITSDVAGFYDVELTAANLNFLGSAWLSFTDADVCAPVFVPLEVVPANNFDSLILGTDVLQADATQILGSAINATTAQIGANLVNIAGSAVATTSAQLGVNLVNVAGSAVSTSTAQIGCNTVSTAANAITGTSLDATAGAEIADSVWDEAYSGHTSAGTFGLANAAIQGANLINIAGSAVSATTAQLGVNVVNMGNAALSTSTAQVGVNVVSTAADAITNSSVAASAASEIATAVLAGIIDGSYTLKDVLLVIGGACAGKATGLDANTPVYRNMADTLNAISAITDASGNRSSVTITTS
jgi:hypothetical protein